MYISFILNHDSTNIDIMKLLKIYFDNLKKKMSLKINFMNHQNLQYNNFNVYKDLKSSMEI